MSVETFELSDMISVTAAASGHFSQQLIRTGSTAIRIGVKESGCTGYKYIISDVKECEANDLKITLDNGVNLVIQPEHLAAIRGTTIDYVQEGVNKNLVMQNPNVKDECGCGESFSI